MTESTTMASTLKTEDKSIILSVEYDLKNMEALEITNYNLDLDIEKIKEKYIKFCIIGIYRLPRCFFTM